MNCMIIFRYFVPLHRITRLYPFISDMKEQQRKKDLLEERKMRILMRGVKIGRKKGGEKISIMSIFEKK